MDRTSPRTHQVHHVAPHVILPRRRRAATCMLSPQPLARQLPKYRENESADLGSAFPRLYDHAPPRRHQARSAERTDGARHAPGQRSTPRVEDPSIDIDYSSSSFKNSSTHHRLRVHLTAVHRAVPARSARRCRSRAPRVAPAHPRRLHPLPPPCPSAPSPPRLLFPPSPHTHTHSPRPPVQTHVRPSVRNLQHAPPSPHSHHSTSHGPVSHAALRPSRPRKRRRTRIQPGCPRAAMYLAARAPRTRPDGSTIARRAIAYPPPCARTPEQRSAPRRRACLSPNQSPFAEIQAPTCPCPHNSRFAPTSPRALVTVRHAVDDCTRPDRPGRVRERRPTRARRRLRARAGASASARRGAPRSTPRTLPALPHHPRRRRRPPPTSPRAAALRRPPRGEHATR